MQFLYEFSIFITLMKFTATTFALLLTTTSFGQFSTGQTAATEGKQFLQLQQYGLRSVASSNYDVLFYNCDWHVDPAAQFISGSVALHFALLSNSNSITLDLYKDLVVDSIVFRNNNIAFLHSGEQSLQVNFPAALNSGVKDSIRIYYHGVPTTTGFGSFIRSTHSGTPVMWTLSEPYGAPTWWPCKDSNRDKPDSISITLHYPAAYTSSSNGLPLAETESNGIKTTHWKHGYPIAPYLVAFAITNYEVDHDAVNIAGIQMPVVMYAYPENAAAFKAAIQVAKTALQGFSNYFIPYPFLKERYAQTQFGWGGGMEHQTNSFIVSPGTGLVAHELGHQWFGDRITCGSWQHLWLNEGAATYMEYIYTELTYPAARASMLRSWTNSITSQPGGSVFIPDTMDINRLFNARLTYLKGGYLLHMLRGKLGDSSFFRGMRRYLNDPALAYKHALTEDLQRNLQAESGQNLTEFFKDWFYGEGFPNYALEWDQPSPDLLRLRLSQTTSHSSVKFFEMPVPIQIKSSTGDTIITVNHTANGQVFRVQPGFLADTVLIDPQLWILSRTKTSRISSTPIADELIIYPNPTTNILYVLLPSSVQSPQTELYNAAGQLVYRTSAFTLLVKIPSNRFAAGVYFLRIVGRNDFHHVQTILIRRR